MDTYAHNFAIKIRGMKQWMQELLLAFQHMLVTDDLAERDAATTPVISLARGYVKFVIARICQKARPSSSFGNPPPS